MIFNVNITDAEGAVCTQRMAMAIDDVPCPFDSLAWDVPFLFGDSGVVTSGSTVNFHCYTDPAPAGGGQLIQEGSIIYTGPIYAATVRVNLTVNNGMVHHGGIRVTHSVSGVIFNAPIWDEGTATGIYSYSFNVPVSIAATITVSVTAITGNIDNDFITGYSSGIVNFCP